LPPVSEDDYAQIQAYIKANRPTWQRQLGTGFHELIDLLGRAGFTPSTTAERSDVAAGHGALRADEIVLAARLKATDAIVAKMRRFGEPVRVMLDVWGYRAVVSTAARLDEVAGRCAELWDTPEQQDLLLRHGRLQFDWWRDYRLRNHAGLSAATTATYDEAIHLNRKAPFGIVEIQVMSFDLYRRVHCDPSSDDSHDRFAARRDELLRRRKQ
jgi:hypothetical protein